MILIGAILLGIVFGTIKSLSFAAWNFREKNYVGGVAMILLSLGALASSVILID